MEGIELNKKKDDMRKRQLKKIKESPYITNQKDKPKKIYTYTDSFRGVSKPVTSIDNIESRAAR